MPANRFTRDHWLDFGLDALKKGGPPALTIDALCEASGKTRGSFYFHFDNMEAFHLALAETWYDRFTAGITGPAPPRTGRQDLLTLLAARLDPALETGIRQLAAGEPQVQAVVTQADRERVAWLESLYRLSGHYTQADAAKLARIEYAALTGFRLIEPAMTDRDARELYEAFVRFTGRA